MRKINFLCPEQFVYMFKRNPKMWSIDQLHDLFVKTSERCDARWKDLSDFIELIVKEVPKFNDAHHVFFKGPDYNLRMTKIRWDSQYQSYLRGIEDIPKPNNRDNRLDYILNQPTDRLIELGERYRELEKLQEGARKSMWVVKSILSGEIEKNLKTKFPHSRKLPEQFTIKIGAKEYFCTTKDKYGSYFKFDLGNEVTQETKMIIQ